MRLIRKTILLLFLIMSSSILYAQEGITTIQSDFSVEKTADRLENVLTDNGVTIFNEIDHRQGAIDVDMELSPTILFIIGNPKLGTPIMQCAQTTAIDLPQKMLIWRNSEDVVQVGYNNPEYLINRHSINGCDEDLKKIGDALHNFSVSAARE